MFTGVVFLSVLFGGLVVYLIENRVRDSMFLNLLELRLEGYRTTTTKAHHMMMILDVQFPF